MKKIRNIETEYLRSKDKKALRIKITRYIAKVLEDMHDTKGYSGVDIAKIYGLERSKQTEYKNYDKYHRTVSFPDLALIIRGGIVTVDELIKNCAETKAEKEFFKSLVIYEDDALREAAYKLLKAGIKPSKILQDALKSRNIK